MKKFFLLPLFCISLFIWSNEEENTTLFSVDLIGKDDLYLNLEGSWKFDLSTFAEGDLSSALENITFTQVPDITASLWLFNKFFFETKITEDEEDNLFLLGYQNSNGILQEIRLGNTDLNISEYANYTPPINENMSPGARIKVKTTNTQHELLGRYTSETTNTINYIGYNSLDKEEVSINNYNSGNYFIIPFSDLSDFNIYKKEDNSYILISDQDYIYYGNKHLLYIKESLSLTSLFIEINNTSEIKTEMYDFVNPLENPGLKQNLTTESLWNKYVTENNGKNYLRLFNSGEFSPFEHLGVYEFTEIDSDAELKLYFDDTKIIDYFIYENWVILDSTEYNYLDFNYRYPYIDIDEEIYSQEGRGIKSEYELSLLQLTEVENITVPDTAKENSLSVLINGFSYTNFEHDTDTNIITFKKEITQFDEITINYKSDSDQGIDNLLLSYGSQFNLQENIILEFSNSISWDFSDDDYTTYENQTLGTFNSSVKLNYENNFIKSELYSNINITNPNTLGSYLLFNFEMSNINIPINSTTLDTNSIGSVSLIAREDSDLTLDLDEIQNLDILEVGGAYYTKHRYNNKSYKTIVIESNEITSGNSAGVNILLNDYQDDYTWATEFSLDIFNDSTSRSLNLVFVNPSLDESEYLVKNITMQASETYKTYILQLTRDERQKLTNIESIHIYIENGPEIIFLIKNINFLGDSLVTHNGTENFYLEEDSGLKITSLSGLGNDEILITSKILEVNINNYKFINFSINDTGLIKDTTDFTIKLKNNQDIISTLSIPSNKLKNLDNDISINLETNEVYINNTIDDEVTWSHIRNNFINKIEISIDQYNSSSNLIISEITLNEGILNLYNESKFKIEFTPSFTYKIGNIEIFKNINWILTNYYINSDESYYKGESDISLDFLFFNINNSFYYVDDFNNINYKVSFPNFDYPITLTDNFYFDEISFRKETLALDLNIITVDLVTSSTTNDETSLSSSELKSTLLIDNFLSLTNTTKLNQENDDSVQDLSNEIVSSYSRLIPKNELETSNILHNLLNIEMDSSVINFKTNITTSFEQTFNPDLMYKNSYEADVSTSIDFKDIIITPFVTSSYYYSDLTDIDTIEDGISNYIDIFETTNPYTNLDFNNLFISTNISNFYDIKIDINSSLDSSLGFSISNNFKFNSLLDIVLPETIEYEINKIFLKEESKETTTVINSLEINLTHNPIIKNKITLSNSYIIEDSSNTFETEWKLILYKQVSKSVTFDFSNDFYYDLSYINNSTNIELEWDGKSGPVLIIPILNKVFNSPYSYTHNEIFYLDIDQENSGVDTGIKHETTLNVSDINKTNFYIEFSYDTTKTDKLYFEMGLYTTIIF